MVDPANGAGANPNPTGAQSSASSTSTDPSGTSAADSAASSSPPPFKLPGTTLSVLPIGLAVFAGISVIALIVVGLVTYERTKYRRVSRSFSISIAVRPLIDVYHRRSVSASLQNRVRAWDTAAWGKHFSVSEFSHVCLTDRVQECLKLSTSFLNYQLCFRSAEKSGEGGRLASLFGRTPFRVTCIDSSQWIFAYQVA